MAAVEESLAMYRVVVTLRASLWSCALALALLLLLLQPLETHQRHEEHVQGVRCASPAHCY